MLRRNGVEVRRLRSGDLEREGHFAPPTSRGRETIAIVRPDEAGERRNAGVSFEGVVKLGAAVEVAEQLEEPPFAQRMNRPRQMSQSGDFGLISGGS
jgi:hypothetical protein